MVKQDLLEFKGKVIDLLPNAMFRVELENGVKVTSAGERDPDADDVSGMSASKLRMAASDNNLKCRR